MLSALCLIVVLSSYYVFRLASANAKLTTTIGDLNQSNASLAQTVEALDEKRAEAQANAEDAERRRIEANDARTQAEQSEADMRRHLYNAEMRVASRAAHEAGGLSTIATITADWTDAEDLIGWEYHYLRRQLEPQSKVFSSVLRWHYGSAIAVSPDGGTVVFKPGADKPITLVSSDTSEVVRELEDSKQLIPSCIRYSSDGTRIAVAASQGNPGGVFSSETGERLYDLLKIMKSDSVDWSADGRWLIHHGHLRQVVYRSSDGDVISDSPHEKYSAWVDCHPSDPTRFASAARGGWLRGSLTDEGQPGTLTVARYANGGSRREVDWHPDGRLLAIADDPHGSVAVWDADQESFAWQTTESIGQVTTVRWSPDGRRLAAAGYDRAIRIHNTTDGKVLAMLRGHERQIHRLAWTPDGTRLFSTSEDETVRVWDIGQHASQLSVGDSEVAAISWSQSGRTLTTSTLNTIGHLDPASNETPLLWQRKCHSLAVSHSPVDDRIATATLDTLSIVAESDGGEVRSMEIPPVIGSGGNFVTSLQWSPDGSRIAYGRMFSGSVWVCDAELTEVQPVRNYAGTRRGTFCWNPDGQSLLVVEAYRSLLRQPLDGSEGEPLATTTDRIFDIALHPHHHLLALGGENLIELRDTENFELQHTLIGHTANVQHVAWSPDGRRLISLTEGEGIIGLWDPATGEACAMIHHPTGDRFTCIAWSPDGTTLAAGDARGEVHLLMGP
ncbi:MAG: hypothetical protein R3C05_19880 [Pirellulaceae bacterium]